MKGLSFSGIILEFISLILLILYTKQLYFFQIIIFVLLIFILFFMIKKNEVKYLLFMFILSYFSIDLIITTHINFYSILYILGFVLTCLYGYFYIFDRINNKTMIKLNNITLPKDKDYIVLKYLSGLPLNNVGNGIIYKDEDKLIIEIENEKDNSVYKKTINKNELDKISSSVKPYIISKEKVLMPSYDYTSQYFTGIAHKNPEDTLYTKSFKPIKSYQIDISLLNGEMISLLSFNDPEKFFIN